jgi:hypothetical protein
MKFWFFVSIVGIAVAGLWVWWSCKWTPTAQRLVGFSIGFYGLYLSTLTASVTKFVIPGIGAIGTGATTGVGIGVATWILLGTLGVVTGGAGYAVGAGLLALIGGSLGAAGAATGGLGFQVFKYPLVHWMFWVPLVAVGLTLVFRPRRRVEREI